MRHVGFRVFISTRIKRLAGALPIARRVNESWRAPWAAPKTWESNRLCTRYFIVIRLQIAKIGGNKTLDRTIGRRFSPGYFPSEYFRPLYWNISPRFSAVCHMLNIWINDAGNSRGSWPRARCLSLKKKLAVFFLLLRLHWAFCFASRV